MFLIFDEDELVKCTGFKKILKETQRTVLDFYVPIL